MQLKNNQTRNAQFYFWKEGKNKKVTLEYVNIPGGATVEIDDQVFKALTASRTEVRVMKEVETKLDEASIGADVKTGKDTLIVKDYYETGETRSINLLQEAIRLGEFTVVERAKVGMDVIDEALTARGVPIKDMTEDAKLALYDQLA
jgi:hypothetical protein